MPVVIIYIKLNSSSTVGSEGSTLTKRRARLENETALCSSSAETNDQMETIVSCFNSSKLWFSITDASSSIAQ